MTKILLLIALLAASAYSQLPDLKKFEFVATIKDGNVMGMTQFIDRNADTVTFAGLVANVVAVKDGKPQLDPSNFSVTKIRASCSTHAFAFLESYGSWDGQFFNNTLEPNTNVAAKDSLIFLAIDHNCTRDLKNVKGQPAK